MKTNKIALQHSSQPHLQVLPPKKPLGLLGRSIQWLRAPNEIHSIKGARKALAIFLAMVLTLSLFGIIPLILGAREWKKQNRALHIVPPKPHRIVLDAKVSKVKAETRIVLDIKVSAVKVETKTVTTTTTAAPADAESHSLAPPSNSAAVPQEANAESALPQTGTAGQVEAESSALASQNVNVDDDNDALPQETNTESAPLQTGITAPSEAESSALAGQNVNVDDDNDALPQEATAESAPLQTGIAAPAEAESSTLAPPPAGHNVNDDDDGGALALNISGTPVEAEKQATKRAHNDNEAESSSLQPHSKKQNRNVDDDNDAMVQEVKITAPKILSTVVAQADINVDKLHEIKFEPISEEKILAMQGQIVEVNKKYGPLNLVKLQQDGKLPLHRASIGDVTYYCSSPIVLDYHAVVIALVEINQKLYPRLFYHSNSQGTWRVMPFAAKEWMADFLADIDEKKIFHYGKGQCETDTQLPIALTVALNGLPWKNAKPIKFKAHTLVESLEFGNKEYRQVNDFKKIVSIEESMMAAPDEHSIKPQNISKPQSISMPQNVQLHPDFSSVKAEFNQNILHYGNVAVKIFASIDKSMLYMFIEAKDGRAFLASAECILGVGINEYGVREKIIELAHMDAPLLEYDIQINPLFKAAVAPGKKVYDSKLYANNWNFVRELEIIKNYYQAQGRELPPPLKTDLSEFTVL